MQRRVDEHHFDLQALGAVGRRRVHGVEQRRPQVHQVVEKLLAEVALHCGVAGRQVSGRPRHAAWHALGGCWQLLLGAMRVVVPRVCGAAPPRRRAKVGRLQWVGGGGAGRERRREGGGGECGTRARTPGPRQVFNPP